MRTTGHLLQKLLAVAYFLDRPQTLKSVKIDRPPIGDSFNTGNSMNSIDNPEFRLNSVTMRSPFAVPVRVQRDRERVFMTLQVSNRVPAFCKRKTLVNNA